MKPLLSFFLAAALACGCSPHRATVTEAASVSADTLSLAAAVTVSRAEADTVAVTAADSSVIVTAMAPQVSVDSAGRYRFSAAALQIRLLRRHVSALEGRAGTVTLGSVSTAVSASKTAKESHTEVMPSGPSFSLLTLSLFTILTLSLLTFFTFHFLKK